MHMRKMNEELRNKGYLVIPGKIPTKYAEEKFYGVDFEIEEG